MQVRAGQHYHGEISHAQGRVLRGSSVSAPGTSWAMGRGLRDRFAMSSVLGQIVMLSVLLMVILLVIVLAVGNAYLAARLLLRT